MKIKKTTKTSTQQNLASSAARDDYTGLFILREVPVSEAFIEKLSSDLIKWAYTDEDALKLCDFLHDRRINHGTFSRWAKKWPMLKEAKNVALEMIGSRREKGAIRNKFNYNMISSQMAKYDPSWWKLEKDRAELKASTTAKAQAAEEGNKKYTIVLDSYKDEDEKLTDNMPKE